MDEGEAAPVRGAKLGEEAAGSVDGASLGLVDGKVSLRGGRGRKDADLRRFQRPLRKRRAERMTARFPAMFAAIPTMSGHWAIRTP